MEELYKEFDTEYQSIVTEYRTKTKQNINKILVYLNHELSLGKDWKLNYGIIVVFIQEKLKHL